MKKWTGILGFLFYSMGCFAFQFPLMPGEKKYRPVLTSDGNRLYFNRDGFFLNYGTDNLPDIWMAEKTETGQWEIPLNLIGFINDVGSNELIQLDFTGNRGIVNQSGKLVRISYDGRMWLQEASIEWPFENTDVVFDASEEVAIFSKDSDLFYSLKQGGGTWSDPMRLNFQVVASGVEGHPHLSPDGNTLYFSSNSFGGFGGRDIFVSRKIGEDWGEWTVPQNLGGAINTSFDEGTPFVSIDGGTIWFTRYFINGSSDLVSSSLGESYRPGPLLNLTVKTGESGAILIAAEGGQILTYHQELDRFKALIHGGRPTIVRLGQLKKEFVPMILIEGGEYKMEGIDRDQPGIFDFLMNHPEYRNNEQQLQRLQRNLLETEKNIHELTEAVYRYVTGLVPPLTRGIEASGFRTDKTLLAIEEAYYKLLGRDLRVDTLNNQEGAAEVTRTYRLEQLRSSMISAIDTVIFTDSVRVQVFTFPELRERTRRYLERALFEEVWKELFSRRNRSARDEIRRMYNRDEFKPLIKGIGLSQNWELEFATPDPLDLGFAEIINRLKDHLAPQVRQLMAVQLKEEVDNYVFRMYQLDMLQKIRTLYLNQIESVVELQKEREEKLMDKQVVILWEDGVRGREIYRELELIPEVYPVVSGQYFELGAIVFPSNDDRLHDWGKMELKRIAEMLAMHNEITIRIRVHTHPQMSMQHADELTGRRAEGIRSYLNELGVDELRCKVVPFGKRKPIVLTQNQESRLRNQRIEIIIEKS
jgi:outer membrane protein OmpA-like peptidoglycan-associated protein